MSWNSKARELIELEAKTRTLDNNDYRAVEWLANHPEADEPYYMLKAVIELALSKHRGEA
jgi:hypothetical protein